MTSKPKGGVPPKCGDEQKTSILQRGNHVILSTPLTTSHIPPGSEGEIKSKNFFQINPLTPPVVRDIMKIPATRTLHPT